MSPNEAQALVSGALQGLLSSTLFLLVLFIGFCVVFGLSKFRPTSRQTMVVRSLDELVGQAPKYLPPSAPRGQLDILRTPELTEAASRKTV